MQQPKAKAHKPRLPRGDATVVEVGTMAASTDRKAVLRTQALGSAVAVALWDPEKGVGGLLHFLMPDCDLDPKRAAFQPELFADRGFELLLHQCEQLGAVRERLRAYVVGGADPLHRGPSDSEITLGVRNVASVKAAIAQASIQLAAERTGGTRARKVALELATGRVHITETPAGGKRPAEEGA